jgi:hypothetical protein
MSSGVQTILARKADIAPAQTPVFAGRVLEQRLGRVVPKRRI